jgi:hypothetical protein
MNIFGKIGIGIGILIVLGLLGLVMTANFIDNYEVGYKFDLRTGKTEIIEREGLVLTPPFLVKVHTIDLRPMQVCINANSRVLNCKLVQFDKDGLETFIEWHGRATYNKDALKNILMSYAYDETNSNYPFLKIIKELNSENTQVVETSTEILPNDTL